MSSKREMIEKMLEMQRKFIEEEHKNGFEGVNYWTPSPDHPLNGYRQEYMNLAMTVVDTAHAEVGSKR
ncbi:MAG: hypothetical protein ACFCUJ_02220 [Thiotrichales bacterium]